MSCPTWLDLSEDSLVPPLGTGKAPSLGPVAVMISTAADLKLIQPIMNAASDQEVPFFVSRLITDSKGISVAGPFVGSPYAAMMMESLIARGAKRILVLGWCGSLRPDIQVGDLIVPDLGLVDEGTSRHYASLDPVTQQTFPHTDLTGKLSDSLEVRGLTCVQGPVWTTDAIYRETPKKSPGSRSRARLPWKWNVRPCFPWRHFDMLMWRPCWWYLTAWPPEAGIRGFGIPGSSPPGKKPATSS